MSFNAQLAGRRLAALPAAALLAIGFLASGTGLSNAEDGPPGITKPTVFAPFNPNAPACQAAPGSGQSAGLRTGQ